MNTKKQSQIRQTIHKSRSRLFVFAWRRDSSGYDFSPDQRLIVRRGGQMVQHNPALDDIRPAPHFLFAKLMGQVYEPDEMRDEIDSDAPFHERRFEDAPGALLEFVREFGFLGSPRWGDEGNDDGAEPLDYLMDQQRKLSVFLDFARDAPEVHEIFNRSAPPMSLRLAKGWGGKRLQISVVPQSLIAWMWLRVAEDCSNGVDWNGPLCVYCYQPMGRGPGAHRIDAKTCTPKCRTYFNRLPEKEKQKRIRKADKKNSKGKRP